MIIKLNKDEQSIIFSIAHNSKYNTSKVLEHYQAILEANFEQDIDDAIKDMNEYDSV